MPKITVIMNCFNGEAYLREAIDSVFAQSFHDWEIVLVDNCSTDRSVEIARTYPPDQLRIVSTGSFIPLFAARNIGLEHAQGDYIAFLDVDDRWPPNALEALLSRMMPEIAFVYGGRQYIDERGNTLPAQRIPKSGGATVNALLISNPIALGSILLHAEICRALKFDPSYQLMGDYELWVRILATGAVCDSVPLALLDNRLHGQSASIRQRDRWIVEQRRFYRAMLRRHGLRYPMILAYIAKYELAYLMRSSPASRLQGIAKGNRSRSPG